LPAIVIGKFIECGATTVSPIFVAPE